MLKSELNVMALKFPICYHSNSQIVLFIFTQVFCYLISHFSIKEKDF